MPFSIRPYRRFPVQCAVRYNAGWYQGQGTAWTLDYEYCVSKVETTWASVLEWLGDPEKGHHMDDRDTAWSRWYIHLISKQISALTVPVLA